nr:glycosyltransferase family A protein [Patulibacter sp. SYSU D01012]
MGRVRVGVVIPVRGFSPYLVQTLDAVVGQDAPAAEIVVVDDASPHPVVVPREHADRVRIVHRREPGGAGAARNSGVAALGDDVDHVAFCDHDDVWGPGHLSAHERARQRHPDAGVLVGDVVVVGPDDRPTGEPWDALHPGEHRASLVLPVVYERHPICVSAAIVRRDAFTDAGGFDEDLARAEDLDLWLRLLERDEPIASVLGATVRYRRHPGALTHDLIELADALLEVHRRHAPFVREPVARRTEAADLRARAAGLARVGEYETARDLVGRADDLVPPLGVERLHRPALGIPGVRARIGMRPPRGL